MLKSSSKLVEALLYCCLTLSLATLVSSKQSYGDTPSHDVAITVFTASPNPVNQGSTITFSVTVKNQGSQTESGVTFRMTYSSTTLIGPIKVPTWKAGQEFSGKFNIAVPRNFPSGDYLVTAELSTVSEETIIDNNKQTVKVTVGSSSPANPFAGAWKGTCSTSDSTGTMILTIARDGQITGSLHYHVTWYPMTSLTATVDAQGSFTGSWAQMLSPNVIGPSTPMQGTMTIDSNGHLTGQITGPSPTTFELTL